MPTSNPQWRADTTRVPSYTHTHTHTHTHTLLFWTLNSYYTHYAGFCPHSRQHGTVLGDIPGNLRITHGFHGAIRSHPTALCNLQLFPPSRKSLKFPLLDLFLGSYTGIQWCLNLNKLNFKRPLIVDFDLMGVGSCVAVCSRPAPLNSALRRNAWGWECGQRSSLTKDLDGGDTSSSVALRAISNYSDTCKNVFPCLCLWDNRTIY